MFNFHVSIINSGYGLISTPVLWSDDIGLCVCVCVCVCVFRTDLAVYHSSAILQGNRKSNKYFFFVVLVHLVFVYVVY